MENNLSHTSNAPLSSADKLQLKAKDKTFWIHTGCLLFLLLYALEPVIGSSDIYWWVMSVLVAIGFIALVGSIIAGFKRKLQFRKSSAKYGKTIYAYLLICLLGITVNYIYLSTLSWYWVSMTLIALAFIFTESPGKRR